MKVTAIATGEFRQIGSQANHKARQDYLACKIDASGAARIGVGDSQIGSIVPYIQTVLPTPPVFTVTSLGWPFRIRGSTALDMPVYFAAKGMLTRIGQIGLPAVMGSLSKCGRPG